MVWTAIEFRMQQLGLDRMALEKCVGFRARVSEMLSRKLRLTLAMTRLHPELDIPAEIRLAN